MSEVKVELWQKFLIKIAEISRRSDVVIRQQTKSWSGPIGKWKAILPVDMFEFYSRINGMSFFYSFLESPDIWHGINFLAIDADGKKVIDTRSNKFHIPRLSVKKYPKYFFDESVQLSSDDSVLFFEGSSDSAGCLMVGAQDDSKFYSWNNDGYITDIADNFTSLVEKMIENGFAHTWENQDHPDTYDVKQKLKQIVEPRYFADVTINELIDIDACEFREKRFESFDDSEILKIAKALGKPAKNAARADHLNMIHQAFAQSHLISEKSKNAILKAIGDRRFIADFYVPYQSATRIDLSIHWSNSEFGEGDDDFLVRVLDSIGVDISSIYPVNPLLLHSARLWNSRIHFYPYLYLEQTEKKPMRFSCVLPNVIVGQLVAGQTYKSSALPKVEGEIH